MEPTDFKEANTVYARNQPQYIPLPAHRDEKGVVTSCWKLNWRERVRILFGAKIYLSQMTFNQPLQPIRPAFDFGGTTKKFRLNLPRRSFLGLTWVGWLNILIFQWFFVRLAYIIPPNILPSGDWHFLMWPLPLTGWWNDFKYIGTGARHRSFMRGRQNHENYESQV